MSDTGSIDRTPQKKGKSRKTDKHDPFRFQGAGINFKAKLIGIDDVQDARGDKMCQESIQRLKNHVKIAGEHKQRIIVNVSLEGLKIIDEKTGNTDHSHAVHRISFISRDVTDARAFGYIYGPGGGVHKFFAIKTEKAAEGLVLTLRDLFQVVFELKKKEIEDAKNKKNTEENADNAEKEAAKEKEGEPSDKSKEVDTVNLKAEDSTSNASSLAVQEQSKSAATGNLLDLENELVTIQEGINQMNAFGDSLSTASDSQSEGSATPSPWGKPDAWGATNGGQPNTAAFPQQQFAAFGQQPAVVQQQAPNTAVSFAADFGQNATSQPDPFMVNTQAFTSSSSSSSQLQDLSTLNAFSSTQTQAFSSTGSSLFTTNTSPFMSSTTSPAFGGMTTVSPPPVQTSGSSSPWMTQNAGTGMNDLFGNVGAMSPPPPQAVAGFGSSVTPPLSNQSNTRVQADPFKNDPFFTTSAPASTQMNSNPFAAAAAPGFGSVPPANSQLSANSPFGISAASSSSFGSNAFGPQPGGATGMPQNTGSANPFELLTPITSQSASDVDNNNMKQPATTRVDPFGDLCAIGSGVQKKNFFKDNSEKPSLTALKVGDDDSLVNADSGRGDSSSSPATSIEWATPPSKHKPTTITSTGSTTLSPPDISDFNLPSPAAPPPPLPSIPGLQFTYATPPAPPPRPGAQKQQSSATTTTVTSMSVTASTTVTVTAVQTYFTTTSTSVSGGVQTSRTSPARSVVRSSSTSSTQSPIIPRPRSKSSQLKSQTSLQFTTDPFAETWQWPDDPTKNDPFTSDPFTSPLDPFGSFTKSDPFSETSKSNKEDSFGSGLETKYGAVTHREAGADTNNSVDSPLKSQQPEKKGIDLSSSDPFAFVANKSFTKKEPSKKCESDRLRDIERDPFKRQAKTATSLTSDSPLSVNTDIASSSDPFAFNPFGSPCSASSPDPFVVSTNQSLLKPKLVRQTSLNPFAPSADVAVEKDVHSTSIDSATDKSDPHLGDPFIARAPEVTGTDPFSTDSFFSGKSTQSSTSDPFAAFDLFSLNPTGGTAVKDTHQPTGTSQKTDTGVHGARSSSSEEVHGSARSNPSSASTSLCNPFDTSSITIAVAESSVNTGHSASRASAENKQVDNSKSSLKLVNPDPFDMFRPQDSEC